MLPIRIERKIVRVPFSGCWIWVGSGHRYGSVWHEGGLRPAHRVVLELSGVEIPPGTEVMHSCDVGFCVNPAHLSVGTHAQNMADMVAKGRSRAPEGDSHWTRRERERARDIGRRNIVASHGCGEANNNAKVTAAIAAAIREEHRQNQQLSMESLGAKHGLKREQTRKIVKGLAWNATT